MKTFFYLLIFFSKLFLLTNFSEAQWKFVVPKPSPSAYASSYFINSTNVLLGGTAGTIVKSSNSGEDWEYVKCPVDNTVYSINFVNENTGYVGGGYLSLGELAKTIDGGATWTKKLLPTSSGVIRRLDFFNENTGFIHSSQNIYYTVNGASNLTAILTPTGSILYSKFENDNIGICITNPFAVYKTTNRGKDWSLVSSNPVSSILDIYFIDMNTGYVLTTAALYKTTNGGQSLFSIRSVTSNNGMLRVKNESEIMIYNSTNDSSRIHQTTNAGVNWNYRAFSDFKNALTFNYDGNTIVAGLGSGNFYVSSNAGLEWDRKFDNSKFPQRTIVLDSINMWSVGINKVHKSTNTGNSWTSFNFDNYIFVETISFINPSTGYVAGLRMNPSPPVRHFLKTTNAGLEWNIIEMPPSTNLLFQTFLKFFDENTGIAVVYSTSNIYKTTNGAVDWFEVHEGEFIGGYMTFVNNTTGFNCRNQKVYKSTNQGSNWFHIANLTGNDLRGISFLNEITGYLCSSQGSIFKTTDSGIQWILLDSNPSNKYRTINFKNELTGFTVTENGYIRYTYNGGIDWSEPIRFINSTSESTDIQFAGENNVYISGYGYIYANKEFTSNIINSGSQIVTDFRLYQNYPNPFNPVTTIKFDVPVSSGSTNVSVRVYDLAGRFVSLLTNQNFNPGSHELKWNASGFASGVYFYVLNAGDFTEAKRMVLLK